MGQANIHFFLPIDHSKKCDKSEDIITEYHEYRQDCIVFV